MKIAIDYELCSGHGRCYDLEPELFDADDAGRGVVLTADVPDHLEGRARMAIASCPEGAIRVNG